MTRHTFQITYARSLAMKNMLVYGIIQNSTDAEVLVLR
jgi:hypothetical protein